MYIKVSHKTSYHKKKREIITNRAKKCYENNKRRLREQARNKYRKLSDEDKNIKKKYGRNR